MYPPYFPRCPTPFYDDTLIIECCIHLTFQGVQHLMLYNLLFHKVLERPWLLKTLNFWWFGSPAASLLLFKRPCGPFSSHNFLSYTAGRGCFYNATHVVARYCDFRCKVTDNFRNYQGISKLFSSISPLYSPLALIAMFFAAFGSLLWTAPHFSHTQTLVVNLSSRNGSPQ